MGKHMPNTLENICQKHWANICRRHKGKKRMKQHFLKQIAAPRQDPSVIRGYWQPVSVAQGASAAPVAQSGVGRVEAMICGKTNKWPELLRFVKY